MTYADGSIQYWGTKNTTDSNPGAATPEDPYFYIMEDFLITNGIRSGN